MALHAALPAQAELVSRETMAALIVPPYALGEKVGEEVYELMRTGGVEPELAGYALQTEPIAALPGFSGAPINIMAMVDLEGKFIDVKLLDHNEPIFVSGLGQQAFQDFFEQYAGHSIATPMVVGVPYGDGAATSSLVYLDGVTKATASIRIAHESLLAATLKVVKEKLQGVSVEPPPRPDPSVYEALAWDDLVAAGIAKNIRVTNAELQAEFEGTLWEDDDREAADDPDGLYLDLWIVAVGPHSIARAALAPDTYEDLQRFMVIADNDEPILMIEAGRHGLVSPEFIRNTAPDWVSATQGGLPVALRDADLIVDLAEGVPAVLFWHFTDFAYHTSLDRMEMLDPEELKRSCVTVMATAMAVAAAEPGDLERYLASNELERELRVQAAEAASEPETARDWERWCDGAAEWLGRICK